MISPHLPLLLRQTFFTRDNRRLPLLDSVNLNPAKHQLRFEKIIADTPDIYLRFKCKNTKALFVF